MEGKKALIKDTIHLLCMTNMNKPDPIKKLLGIIWEDLNLRTIKYLPMKVIKCSYVILIIKYKFFLMEYIPYHMVTKIYQQEIDKVKQKCFPMYRTLNMNEADWNKFLSYITNNAKDEKTREKLKYLFPYVTENRNRKSKDFQKSVKEFKNDENYKFIHPLVERHFLLKAVQKLNEEVLKNNRGSLVDLIDRIYEILEDKQCYIVKKRIL